MSMRVNELMTRDLRRRFEGLAGCVVVDYTNLSTPQINAFRAKARERGVRMTVVKNSLAYRAFEQLDMAHVNEVIEGPSAVVYGDDPAAVAREVAEWKKEDKAVGIRGGALAEELLGADEVKALAEIPPRDQLLGILAGTFQAPVRGFVQCLSGVTRQFVQVLSAIADEKDDT